METKKKVMRQLRKKRFNSYFHYQQLDPHCFLSFFGSFVKIVTDSDFLNQL